jgi:hypothetical protein
LRPSGAITTSTSFIWGCYCSFISKRQLIL